MAVCLVLPNVELLDTGVWKAKLGPEDLQLFHGGEAARLGALSVLLLSSAAWFEHATGSLTISLAFAQVLILGRSGHTIIVESLSTSGIQTSERKGAHLQALFSNAQHLSPRARVPRNLGISTLEHSRGSLPFGICSLVGANFADVARTI
jgi:hypothetical protein